jgi:hypothetical protein
MGRIGWCVLVVALVLLHALLMTACGGGATGGSDAGSGGALGASCTPGAANTCASGLDCPDGVYDATGPRCTYACASSDPNPLCTDGCNPKGYCRLPQ